MLKTSYNLATHVRDIAFGEEFASHEHLYGAFYFLIGNGSLIPDMTGEREDHLQRLELIAYLSDEVLVCP